MSSCLLARASISRCLWQMLFVGWIAGAPTATPAASEPTLWSHNGSVLYLIAKGASREFYYEEPRPGMLQAGAYPGALLYRGQSINHQYSGTAYIFDSRCGQLPYQVSGPILDGYERVVLTGRAPQVGSDCRITGYVDDILEFRLIKAPGETPTSQTPGPVIGNGTPPPTAAPADVNLKTDGGILMVPVQINGALTLDFIIDSGASDVAIPADVVSTLMRTGTLRRTDFIGERTYILADGSEAPSQAFTIRSLKIGDRTIENVQGSIASAKARPLLGQSFLRHFRSWSIDNARNALVLE
jgi:gag-polyprotein putative aspartyl protease